MKRPKALIVAGMVGLLAPAPSLQAGEEFLVKWAGLDVSASAGQLGSDLRIVFVSGLPEGSFVADATTDPPSPFEGAPFSLYVHASGSDPNWFRLAGRPFVEAPPRQGQMEFELSVLSGAVGIILGSTDLPWSPEVQDSYTVVHAQVSVTFAPGSCVQVRGRDFVTDSVETIEEGRKYTFLVKWDFEASPDAPFALYLNGERLTSPGEASAFRLPENSQDAGINAFRVALGSSESHNGVLFLGRIAASGGSVDLGSPKGILGEQP